MKTLVFACIAVIGCAPVDAAVVTPTPQVVYVAGAPASSFVMWNSRTTLPAGRILALGLPDTFTARIQFTATTPVRARIMTFDEYAGYMNTGKTAGVSYDPATTLDVTFHDAEGCGAYLVVFDAAAESVISPNVTITRVEAHPQTGVCAQ